MLREDIGMKKKTDKGAEQNAQGVQSYLQPGTLKYDLTAPRSRRSDDWLITYTDMVTLLITLFIVMIAHSTFEKKDNSLLPLIFQDSRTMEELKEGAGDGEYLSHGDVIYLGDFPAPDEMDEEKKRGKLGNLDRNVPPPSPEKIRRANQLQKAVDEAGMSDSVDIEVISDEIEVRINEKVLFSTAETKLFPQGEDFLAGMFPTLHAGDFEIVVEGHTDNVPIATDQYPSNWELSAARALSVVHYLEDQGIVSQRLQAVSYGETRPIASNDEPEGRSKNRRVQIILR